MFLFVSAMFCLFSLSLERFTLFDIHRFVTWSFEEYTDYIFPEETGMAPNLKILEAAYKWKRQKTGSDDEA